MEILQPYNNNTLQLISDNDNNYEFIPELLQDGIIKLSIFSDVGFFIDNEDLQEDIDFYVKDTDIFLKPNEFLDRKGFNESNYNLQYDFLRRLNLSNLHISEVSPSRKEIRLSLVNDSIIGDLKETITNFLTEDSFGSHRPEYQFNSFLELSQGRLIPINGYAYDGVTDNKNTLVLKLNQPLPSDIPVLTQDFNLANKFLSSQTETIFFIDREGLAISGLGLTIDEGYITEPIASFDSYDNYNTITGSVGVNVIEEIVRQQKDLNLNIDYEKFDGHVFFGSAKSKLENFKTKAIKLEGFYNQISQSLTYSSSLKVIQKRESLFKEIRNIEDEFTHYEHFMYHDGQSYSTSSAPGVGDNLAGKNFINNSDNEFTTLDVGFDGFNKTYKKTENGFIHLFNDIYNVEKAPFYNSNDFFYLSFILRGAGTTSEYALNISGGLANENFDGSADSYSYYKDRKIPYNAWSGSAILNPMSTGSHYERYIFKAQQNYFRPTQKGPSGLVVGDETYGKDSNRWEILSGSSVVNASTSGSTGDGFAYGILDLSGKFSPYLFPRRMKDDGTIDDTNFYTGSYLPQGDLFPVYTQEAGNKQAIFTDVVVTKNDPTHIQPFSKIYRPPSGSYGGSSKWNDWYNTMETIADDYDNDNIHSLVNNLPEFLQTGDEHKTLRDFVNMLGEQFDLLRSYIDNYHNIYKLGYKNPNAMPDNLLPIIGSSLGFDLKNPLSGSLENYLESTRGDEVSDKKAIASLWTKILNNLVYIYKTKGTRESINTLLNLYGYDTNSFSLTEFGGSTDEHNPTVVSNKPENDLDNGLRNTTGNVSYIEKTEPLNTMNFSSGSDKLALDWYSNDAEPNGVEFILKTTNTNNEQTILRSSGSNDNWDLKIIPSGSSDTVGKIEFRINNSEGSSGAIGNNAISMSTSYIDNMNDNKFINVMIQKDIVTGSAEVTQSYSLFVARQDDDKIKDVQHVSMSSSDTFANKNFMTASGQTGNNFILGEEMTGSIGEVRAWDSVVSMSKFKQHTLNYNSIVAGTPTASRNDLVYHFPLNEGPEATTIKDISSTEKIKDFSKTISNQPNLSTIKSSTSTVKNFSFGVKGVGAEIKSDKQYKIGSELNVVGGLSDKESNIKQPTIPGTDTQKVEVVNKIGKTYSYVDAIDSIIINAMADFSLDDYLDDYDNNGIYDELLELRKRLIQERKITVDVVSNLRAVEEHTDDPGFIEKLEEVLPAKTKFEFAYEVKNDTLFRPRIKRADLQTELNPNKTYGETNLTEPTVTIDLNENKHEKSIDVPTDELTITGLANENFYKKSMDILTDEVSVTSIYNENVKTNHSTPLDVVDLTNSSKQSVFNITLNNFTDLLLGSQNDFYKNYGADENQTFFKSGNVGANGDYNTYKYEPRFFFRTIGDTEGYFPVSGSYSSRSGTNAKQPFHHHDNFRHFGNRYYVDSGSGYTYNSYFGSHNASTDGRMVGRTLFFSSSNGEIFYPSNHYSIVGTSKDMIDGLIYKGTQNIGKNPPQFDPELDTSPKIPAYTINVGGSDTVKKLKVIR